MKRTPPNLRQKLAALIVAHFGIPREVAKVQSVHWCLSLVDWDHDPLPVALAKDMGLGPSEYNHPSNLVARIHEDHAIKTAKHDVPGIAKSRRISEAHAEFRQRLLSIKSGVGEQIERPRGKMKSRPFPKTRRVRTARFDPKVG